MKSCKLGWIIGIIAAVSALSAALTAFFIIQGKKKKDEEELDRYLEDAIQ